MESKLKNKNILIIGLGLIGGTYAKILTDSGLNVEAIDINKDSIDFAIQNKYIKNGYTDVKEEYFQDKDLIIFCLYPKVFLEWIKKYKSFIKKGTLVTDVTGIKSIIVNDIQKELEGIAEFVPSHPMAGTERSGVQNVNTKVFQNANFIIIKTYKNTDENIAKIHDLANTLGFSRITILDPIKHDEMIAYLSQLTHVIAISLMTGIYDDGLAYYTGDSFRDLTRIARINENMWTELFLANKDALLMQMNRFEIEFNKMKEYLIKDDVDKIKDMMIESTKRRELFDKKNRI